MCCGDWVCGVGRMRGKVGVGSWGWGRRGGVVEDVGGLRGGGGMGYRLAGLSVCELWWGAAWGVCACLVG